MNSWILVLPATGLIVLSTMLALTHRRMDPRRAATVCLTAMILPTLAVLPVLVHLSIGAAVSIPRFGSRLHDFAHHDGVHTRPNLGIGLVASMFALVAFVRIVRLSIDYRKQSQYSGEGIELLDTVEPVAYSRPGRESSIVLSTGAVAILSISELRAVLAHETCHRRMRHDLYLLCGAICVSIVPVLRVIHNRLLHSLERWADDFAADRCESRTAVAEALVKLTTGMPLSRFALGASTIGVVERIRLLTSDTTPSNARSRFFGSTNSVVVACGLLVVFQWILVARDLMTVCS